MHDSFLTFSPSAFYGDEYEELLERQLTKYDLFLDDFVPNEYIRYRRAENQLYSPRQMQMKRILRGGGARRSSRRTR